VNHPQLLFRDEAVVAESTPLASERARRVFAPPSWTGLAWTLVRADFKARYHGTVSGFVWALLKPAGIFVVLMGVFSFIFPKSHSSA